MRNADLFDEYLSGRLSGEERADFESRLKNDAELEKEFQAHRELTEAIRYALTRSELKRKMEAFHGEAFGKPNMVAMGPRPNYLKVAAVAASVSLLVFMSGFLIYRLGLNKSTNSQYEQLVLRAVEKMEDVQRGIQLNQSLRIKKEFAPANFEATGFAISTKGYFLTSLHTVKNADSVRVLNDELDYVPAERVWEDPNLDVAIFRLKSTDGIKIKDVPISFRNGGLDLGEKVFAMGYPRETVVYSEGNVSAGSGLNGDTTKYQLSLLINPGNSGSPVLDEQGNLIGIISGRNTSAQGVSYAIKAQYVYDMIRHIPDEKLRNEIMLNGKNTIRKLRRTEQVKKLKPFIFNIKVYNSNVEE